MLEYIVLYLKLFIINLNFSNFFFEIVLMGKENIRDSQIYTIQAITDWWRDCGFL